VVEHSANLDHGIQLHDTSILSKKSGHMECIIKGVTENEFHPDSMNKVGFSLSTSWKPLIQVLKERKKTLSKKK